MVDSIGVESQDRLSPGVSRVRVFLFIGLICLSVVWIGSARAESSPAAIAQGTVDQFHAALNAAIEIDTHRDRESALLSVVQGLFDVPRIAAISLGRTWRKLDGGQKDEFVQLLTQLIAATYAGRFSSASDLEFDVEEVAAVKQGHVVRTQLRRDEGKDVSLDYLLHDGRIFNVIADGVSDLSLRRADYNSIIKNEGYVQLTVYVRAKLTQARDLP